MSDSFTASYCNGLSSLKYDERRKYFNLNIHFAAKFFAPATLLPRVVATIPLPSLLKQGATLPVCLAGKTGW